MVFFVLYKETYAAVLFINFFSVIVNDPAPLTYLTALMPTAEDAIVPVKPEKTSSQDSEDSASEKPSQEPTENPFLKPAKRRKTTART